MGLVAEKATSRIGKSKIVLKERQVTRPSQHLNKPISGVNFIKTLNAGIKMPKMAFNFYEVS